MVILNYLRDFISNDIVRVALLSVVISQSIKVLLMLILDHKIQKERILGDGGMPSSHSAVVTSIACLTGYIYGFDSHLFGIAFIFAYIVMHDAKGVRFETGKQAEMLNDIVDLFIKMGQPDISPEKKLKEFVGHTPMQVLAGFCLGLIIGTLYYTFII